MVRYRKPGYDTTPGAVTALGGAGEAVQGLQDYERGAVDIQAKRAQMASDAAQLRLGSDRLAESQREFERVQSFRENQAKQHTDEISALKTSSKTEASVLLDAAMGAEGTTPTPTTPGEGQQSESPLAPSFRHDWRKLRESLNDGTLQGEAVIHAIQGLGNLHATAIVKAHSNDLIGRIHNAQAGGAYTISDEEAADDPELEHLSKLPEMWAAGLKDGTLDPSKVEADKAVVETQIVKEKTRLHIRQKRTLQWQTRMEEAHNSGSITDDEFGDMAGVLQRLHNGEFQDKTTGTDDAQRFEMHMKAAQAGQMILKTKLGEVPFDPKAAALLQEAEIRLALAGTRKAPGAAAAAKPAKQPTQLDIEKAATQYANAQNPDNAQSKRDPKAWRASFDEFVTRHPLSEQDMGASISAPMSMPKRAAAEAQIRNLFEKNDTEGLKAFLGNLGDVSKEDFDWISKLRAELDSKSQARAVKAP